MFGTPDMFGTPMVKSIAQMSVDELRNAVKKDFEAVNLSEAAAAQIIASAKRGFPPRWTADSISLFGFMLDEDE